MKIIKLLALLSLVGLYSCGEKWGTCTTYYKDGETVRSKVPCNLKNGYKNGVMKIFKKNGDLWQTIVYVENKIEDTTRFYYSRSGEILKVVPMLHGQKEGTAIEYSRDGKVLKEQPYKDGKKEGTHKEFDEDGRLIAEEYFMNGLKEKVSTYYYEESDQLKESISFIQNVRNGAYQKFDEKGRLILSGAYKNGRPTGEWTFRSVLGTTLKAQASELAYAYSRDIMPLDDYLFENMNAIE